MPAHKLRHRHAVFLPVFALLLLISAFPMHAEQATARLTSFLGDSHSGEPFALEDGTYGVVAEGAELSVVDGMVLEKGAVLLSREGLMELTLHDVSIFGLSGAFHVILGSTNYSIAALTTPVLIRSGDERVLVPVGYQWEAPLAETLPPLKDGYTTWMAARSVRLMPEHFMRESLRTLQKAEASPVETPDDTYFASTLTAMEQFHRLSSLMPHEELWMLASVHPRFRAQAWSLPEEGYTVEARLVRLIAYPYLDGSSEPVESFAFSRWTDDVKGAALGVELPEKFLERIFHVHVPLVEQMRSRGYPERAAMLARELRNLLQDWSTALPEELQSVLLTLQRDAALEIEQEEPETEVEKVLAQSIVQLAPEEIRSRASVLLQAQDALFTVNTTIEPLRGTQARIQEILFGGVREDRLLNFTIDVLSQKISAIEMDGKTYPFQMSLEAFLTWVQS